MLRSLRVLVACALLAACHAPAEDTAAPRTSTSEPWSYPGAEADTASTAVDAQTLAADVQMQVQAIGHWLPEPLAEAYAAAESYKDAACPAIGSLEDATLGTNTWWYGACETAGHVRFNGVMTAWAWADNPVDATQVVDIAGLLPEGYLYTGGGFEGRIDIYDSEGAIDFSCSCEAVEVHGVAEGGAELFGRYTRGPASWSGVEADGTWMEETGVRPKVWVLHDYDAAGNHGITASTEVSGVGNRYSTSLLHVTLRADAGATTCREAHLQVEARDAETDLWSTVSAASTDGCSVCFDALGDASACVDLSPLLTEDPRAW